jgi:chemotaxis protein methyltransferase CheR
MQQVTLMKIAEVPQETTLSDEDFAKFCEFFYKKTGMLFEYKKKYFVERRIIDRMSSTKSDSFREYFHLVRFESDGKEMQRLVNQMTVNETYFFREDYQFKALVEGVLPEMTSRQAIANPIKIWSMPCSTGEEPYSLAIHILEYWQEADRFDIQILASDIDSAVLSEAAAGVYGTRSLQRLSPALVAKYFNKLGPDRFQITKDLRQSIDFSQGNVVDPGFMKRFRGIDIIFCRNMLIYFDEASQRETLEAMYDCMAPGGYICLGHSESMSRMSSLFRPRKFGDTILYQKPSGKN